jgi:hypothetical protein
MVQNKSRKGDGKMIRDWRILLFTLMVIVLLVALLAVWQTKKMPEDKPVPVPETVEPENKTSISEPKWYVQFSVAGQKSTYYTESAWAPASASAKGYFIGSGAVHPLYPLNAGGEAREPIIPFGTKLYLSQPLVVQGQPLEHLEVNDTGDVYYGLWRKYPYWVDVYAGQTNYYNNKAALESGVDLIDYYWYQPWK